MIATSPRPAAGDSAPARCAGHCCAASKSYHFPPRHGLRTRLLKSIGASEGWDANIAQIASAVSRGAVHAATGRPRRGAIVPGRRRCDRSKLPTPVTGARRRVRSRSQCADERSRRWPGRRAQPGGVFPNSDHAISISGPSRNSGCAEQVHQASSGKILHCLLLMLRRRPHWFARIFNNPVRR